MAREIWHFAVTIPAGTPIANPQLTALTIPTVVVQEVEIIIPPGPRGNVGFALAAAGKAMLPRNPSQFFVADNEQIRWPVEEQITSGAWQLLAYNTGVFPHTLELRFLTILPEAPRPPERPALRSGLALSRTAPAPTLSGGAVGSRPLAHVGFGGA